MTASSPDKKRRGRSSRSVGRARGRVRRFLLAALVIGAVAAASALAGWLTPPAAAAAPPQIPPIATSTTGASTVFGATGSSGASVAQPAPADSASQKLYLYGSALTQVNRLTGQAAVVQAEIDTLDAGLERYSEAYNELAVKVDRINATLTRLRQQSAQAKSDHDLRVQQMDDRMRGVYKSGGRDGLLPMLFLADGIEDLYNRIVLISQLADQDAKLVEDLKASKKVLNDLLADIEAQKREQLSLRRQMSGQRQEIAAKLAERKTLLSGIDTEIGAVLETERKRQAEEQERVRRSLLGLYGGGQAYSGAVPQNGDPVLDQLVETAAFYVGVPYVWGGERPSTGLDCSGFTQYVYAQHGIALPHYSGYQAQMGTPVDPTVGIQTGDLLAFGFPVHHVGIYVGDGMYIHAAGTGSIVKMATLSQRSDLSAIRRFPLQPRAGAPAVN